MLRLRGKLEWGIQNIRNKICEKGKENWPYLNLGVFLLEAFVQFCAQGKGLKKKKKLSSKHLKAEMRVCQGNKNWI